MRRAILSKSVRRFLDPDESLTDVAVLWNRHRLMVPYSLLAFALVTLLGIPMGFDAWTSRMGLGAAAAAVAALATTEYRVLALTSSGFVLLRSSRVRQYAVGVIERMPASIRIEMATSQMVMSEWLVGDVRYSVSKSSEQSITRMAVGS